MRTITLLVLAALTTEVPEWGSATDGLTTRLTLVSRDPKIGAAVKLRLEVRNAAANPRTFDGQQAAVNESLEVTGPDGKKVPYVAMSFQTSGGPEELRPGQTATVFDNLDVAGQYLIDRPGKYSVKFVGRGGLPASNTLALTVADAPLPDKLKLLSAMHHGVPKGWRVAHYDSAIVLLNQPTGLKKDATSVSLYFAEPKEPRQKGVEYVANTTLGHAWIQPESPKVGERWPAYVKFIREQLAPFHK